jgi:hypothetical protein
MKFRLSVPEVKNRKTKKLLDLILANKYQEARTLAKSALKSSSCTTEENFFYAAVIGIGDMHDATHFKNVLKSFGDAWTLAPDNCQLQIELMIVYVCIQQGKVKMARGRLRSICSRIMIKEITGSDDDESIICLREVADELWTLIEQQATDTPKLPGLKFKGHVDIFI